jgi:hypothetical protein
MKRKVTLSVCLLLTLAGAGAGARSVVTADDTAEDYEVWVIDQSDTRPDGGGTLYVYQGGDLEGADAAAAVPEVLDLGGAARDLCVERTGTAPRRPHMFFFSPSKTHAAVAFVTTGHVLFMDVVTKAPVGCVDVGVQAHAAVPSHDGTFVVVANQNGRLLQRINTDYATNTFALDAAATLDLAACTTPSGAPCQDPVRRPSNRPICPVIDASDNFTFVTLAGGGLFVVDSRATPMSILGEYDRETVHPEGCGGVQAGGRMYINSGGPLESDLYSFPLAGYTGANPPNTPAPTLVFTHDGTVSDSHGAVRTNHERFMWIAERFGNNITVVDTEGNSVVNQFSLVGQVSDDPTPDLMDISPGGNRVFMALRGPNPLSGNNPAFNNSAGSTPGIGIIRVEQGGRRGVFFARVPISHVVGGVERADPHGLKVLVK